MVHAHNYGPFMIQKWSWSKQNCSCNCKKTFMSEVLEQRMNDLLRESMTTLIFCVAYCKWWSTRIIERNYNRTHYFELISLPFDVFFDVERIWHCIKDGLYATPNNILATVWRSMARRSNTMYSRCLENPARQLGFLFSPLRWFYKV
jgi:hypothetical protein